VTAARAAAISSLGATLMTAPAEEAGTVVEVVLP